MEACILKVLFTYRTVTGNTKQVIDAMFDAVQIQKERKPWNDTISLEGHDLSFIGFPIEMFGLGLESKDWLEENVNGQRIALVITHGSPNQTPPLQEWLQKSGDAAKGADIIDLFHCQGDMSEQLIEGMLQSGNPQFVEWAKHARDIPRGFLDEEALQQARRFAQDVIEKAS
ncbi:MAG: flavodoxin family protein [Candidatus Thorarchaeota archaeon]